MPMPLSPPVAKMSQLTTPAASPGPRGDTPSLAALLPPPSAEVPERDPQTREEILRVENDPARIVRGLREQVFRQMAHLLELAYMAFDQKKFDRCIKLCEQILVIDPRYPVAGELKTDCEKSRHIEGYSCLVAWKVEEWKKLTDDDEPAQIPWAESVCLPSWDEWTEIAKRITDSVRVEGSIAEEDDPDILAIERKLDTMEIDLAFENTRLEDILSFIRDFSGLNLLLDAELRDHVDPDRIMSFKVKGLVLKHVLRMLGSVLGFDYVVTEEKVVLLTAPYRVPLFNRQK
jgi:hypothetical protein